MGRAGISDCGQYPPSAFHQAAFIGTEILGAAAREIHTIK